MALLYFVGNVTLKCLQGNRIFLEKPTVLWSRGLKNTKIKDIYCGHFRTIISGISEKISLNGEGVLIGSGNNYFNQIGPSKNMDTEISDWYEISMPEQKNNKIEEKVWKVVGGLYHTFAYIKGTNQGYVCGNNNYGQCGYEYEIKRLNNWRKITIPEDEKIHKIDCGHDHSLILTESNNLYICGLNTDGQASKDENQIDNICWGWNRILLNGKNSNIKEIVCGDDFNFCQDMNNDWYGWGNNELLQLCIDDEKLVNKDKIRGPKKSLIPRLKSISLGNSFGIGLDNDGNLWKWGGGFPDQSLLFENNLSIYKNFKNIPISQIKASTDVFGYLSESNQVTIIGRSFKNLYSINNDETNNIYNIKKFNFKKDIISWSLNRDHASFLVNS